MATFTERGLGLTCETWAESKAAGLRAFMPMERVFRELSSCTFGFRYGAIWEDCCLGSCTEL